MHFAALDREEPVVARGGGKNAVEVVAVGVGDEGLAEALRRHQRNDLLHAAGIEAVPLIFRSPVTSTLVNLV